MKCLKTLLLLVAMLVVTFNAKADQDQVINFNQLPASAQTMLKKNFADKAPLVVTKDLDDYTIIYDSGEKVEFDKKGNWTEIYCRSSQVPSDLVPQQIKEHIKAKFPGASIIKLERNHISYEVKLSNGKEIEYDTKFKVIEIE